MEITTADVVSGGLLFRTPSPVERPSLQPTAVWYAEHEALMRPLMMSSKEEGVAVRLKIAQKSEVSLCDPEKRSPAHPSRLAHIETRKADNHGDEFGVN